MNILKILIDCRHDMLEKNSTLDLHGLHVDEAIAALERILPSRELVRVICKKYHLRGEANFACPRNRYFSQITLTNRTYLFHGTRKIPLSKENPFFKYFMMLRM
jgi:hypothetical protein